MHSLTPLAIPRDDVCARVDDEGPLLRLQALSAPLSAYEGNKARHLQHLIATGLPVPSSCVVPDACFQRALANLDLGHTIEVTLRLDPDDACFDDTLRQVQKALLEYAIPDSLRRQITDQFAAFPALIVRSSAAFEDGEGASMAGQLRSFVVYTSDDAARAVVRCWASLFEPSTMRYLHRVSGRELSDVAHMGVVIQRWVEPRVSGVSFTRQHGAGSVVTESVFGRGELLVQGVVSPDSYMWRGHGDLRTTLASKLLAATALPPTSVFPADEIVVSFGSSTPHDAYVMDVDPCERAVYLALPDGLADIATLTEEQAISISGLCLTVDALYGRAVDIEWVCDGAGNIFIVQVRASTASIVMESATDEEGDDGNSVRIAAPGFAAGWTRVADTAEQANRLPEGDILVTLSTTPDHMPALLKAGGVICEEGGLLSHTAIVCREMGVPCLVGVEDATRDFRDGEWVTLDAYQGRVVRDETMASPDTEEITLASACATIGIAPGDCLPCTLVVPTTDDPETGDAAMDVGQPILVWLDGAEGGKRIRCDRALREMACDDEIIRCAAWTPFLPWPATSAVILAVGEHTYLWKGAAL